MRTAVPVPRDARPGDDDPAGVVCAARPTDSAAALQSPHMVLAYATGADTTGPLEQRLAGRKTGRTGNPHIMVSAVQLVQMRHDGRCVTWRTLETLAIGSGRRESRH